MQPVTANTGGFVNGVEGSRNHEYLTQIRPSLYIAGLLQQIGPHAAGGLTEELGDIQNAKGVRSESSRQSAPRDVQRGLRLDSRE